LYFLQRCQTIFFFFRSSSSNDDQKIDVAKLDPIKFNDEKRKRMGDAIHHSFLHPKPFKIGKLSLPKPTNIIKDEKKTEKQKVVKESKHKFNIL
jgi:hypothetical protein